MPTLVPYTQADYAAVHAYFPDKEIRKYTNRGGVCTALIINAL